MDITIPKSVRILKHLLQHPELLEERADKEVELSMVKTPWYAKMGVVPCHLEYQQCTMEEAVEKIAEKYPKLTAYQILSARTRNIPIS